MNIYFIEGIDYSKRAVFSIISHVFIEIELIRFIRPFVIS
jgi:hypothetical protein